MPGKLSAYALAAALCMVSPLLAPSTKAIPRFAGWPSELDGRALQRLPDSEQERSFYARYPVEHARFSDGTRVVLMRWAGEDISGFHLAEPCFRAFGFTLSAAQERSSGQRRERCVNARRGALVERVCEHIRDGQGHTFSGETEWQLARLLGNSRPPYLGVSVVEILPDGYGSYGQRAALRTPSRHSPE